MATRMLYQDEMEKLVIATMLASALILYHVEAAQILQKG